VPQPWLGFIKLGDEVQVRVDSFGDDVFRDTIEQINRQAEFTPRNVQTVEDRIRQVFGVKMRLENRDDKLRAGMSADVTFPNVPTDEFESQKCCTAWSFSGFLAFKFLLLNGKRRDDRVRWADEALRHIHGRRAGELLGRTRFHLRLSRAERLRQIHRYSHVVRNP